MGELISELFSQRYEIGVYSRGEFETEFTVFDSLSHRCTNPQNTWWSTTPAEEIKDIVTGIRILLYFIVICIFEVAVW